MLDGNCRILIGFGLLVDGDQLSGWMGKEI